MLIKEMHILFDNLLQEMNSNRKGTVLPDEKDLRINVATLKWVKSRLSKKSNLKGEGLDDTTIRYDNLKELKKTVSIPTYIDSSNQTSIKYVRAILPPDYFHLISSMSLVSWNCNGISLGSPVVDTTAVYYPASLNPYASIEDDIPPSGNSYFNTYGVYFYSTFGDDLQTLAFSTATSFKNIRNTFKSNEPKFTLVNLTLFHLNNVITTLNNNYKVRVWWEYYDDLFRSNQFIFEQIERPTGITDDLSSVVVFSRTSPTTIGVIHTKNVINRTRYSPSNASLTNYFKNRLIDSEKVANELRNPFGKTVYHSPISELSNKHLKIYYDNTFYPSEVQLTYLKVPRPVNIWMNWSSEINPNYHEEIVRMAVTSVKADITDEHYQKSLQELITIE